MKDPRPARSTGPPAASTAERRKRPESVFLRLYVTGTTRRSTLAIAEIRRVCERYLRGRYDLEIVDLYQQPALAREDQIVAVPTLVKRYPAPERRMVGDLSRQERVRAGLGLRAAW